MRELTTEELSLVSGGFEWNELGGAMVGGFVVGGLGTRTWQGAIAGGILGGIGYVITDCAANYW